MQASRRAYRCSGEPSHTGSNDPEQPFPKAKLKASVKCNHVQGAGAAIRPQAGIALVLLQAPAPRKLPHTHTPSALGDQ